MKVFETSFANVLIRFYLMMAVVITAGFTGFWALGLLALPLFLGAILGLGKEEEVKKTTSVKTMITREKRVAA